MKHFVPSNFLLLFTALSLSFSAASQSGPGGGPGNGNGNAYGLGELAFNNPVLISGTAGANNAVYKFPAINNDLDAQLKIVGRSSNLVTLAEIDLTNTGFAKAFQPRLVYNNGNAGSAVSYWMEFEITFVNKNSVIPANINSFDVTALDVDGNNGNLRETNSFYNFTNYTLENNSALTVSNLLSTVLGVVTTVGKTLTSPSVEYGGIDTTATDVMATFQYTNSNTLKIRVGATTTGSSSNTNRLSSFWFKRFQYTAAIVTPLPLDLVSFNASLNKSQVDLKWVTMNEVNVSHFIIEKSLDGKIYIDAGVVMAYGTTSEKKHYSFTDNITHITQGLIYYRLRSYDIDGSTQVSGVRIIRVGKQSEVMTLSSYPNPVINEVNITLPAAWQNKPLKIEIFNASGQLVKVRNTASASQTETFSMASFGRGLYVIKATNSMNEVAQQKIIRN